MVPHRITAMLKAVRLARVHEKVWRLGKEGAVSLRVHCNDCHQAVARSGEPRHHGADRHLGHLGDLTVSDALDVAQHQRLAERCRQRRDRRLE